LITAADTGDGSITGEAAVTVTDQPPVLQPVPDQTVSADQQVVMVALSASDADGDPLTFSAAAQSLAYVLRTQNAITTYDSGWDNWGGRGEKWFRTDDGRWYFLLADGQLYRWDGSPTASGTLLGTLGSTYYDTPALFLSAPADEPRASFSFSANV